MNKLIKTHLIISSAFFIASCSNLAQKNPDNKPVRLIQKSELNIVFKDETPDCRYIGEIVGSEGHWYTYLFISNKNLIKGALNDLHNSANAVGANVVYISDNVAFTTSVTFYGQAYACNISDDF